MTDLNVRIVSLEPMTIAAFRAFGESPESAALEQLRAWAEPKGLLEAPDLHPVFGFNNPSPSPGKTEYGYEFWIALEPDQVQESGIQVKEFPGGLYAVTRCKFVGESSVPETWRALWEWVQSSEYRWRETHELEKVTDLTAPQDEIELDLYLPIERTRA